MSGVYPIPGKTKTQSELKCGVKEKNLKCSRTVKDLMANRSVEWIRYQKEKEPKKPILLTLNFPAPHGPEDAAQKYQGVFNNTATQRVTRTGNKNYNNIEHNPSKNWLLSQITNRLSPETEKYGDLLYQKRLQVS